MGSAVILLLELFIDSENACIFVMIEFWI